MNCWAFNGPTLILRPHGFLFAVDTVLVGNVGRTTTTTKNGRARSVPLPSSTTAVLNAHKAQQATERMALGLGSAGPGDYVFSKDDGLPYNPHTVSDMFGRLVRSSGLTRICLHDLRHTFATLALQALIPVKVVSEILGHSSVQITYDIYSHVIPSMQEDATTRVADLISGR